MGKQNGTLRAFTVNQNLPLTANIDLIGNFKNKYENTSARERLLKLSSATTDHEHDIINTANFENNVVFCSLMRLDLDINARNVPDALLDENSFPFDSLQSEETRSNIYKKHFYFCFNNKYLISTLPGNYTIGSFQTYINWLLQSVDRPYEINPLAKSNNEIKLSNIKSIIFGPTTNSSSHGTSSQEISFTSKVISLGLDKIKSLLNDTISLSSDELTQIVSAKLLLSIQKPKLMSEEEYQRKFGAIMKPIADGENIQYETTNGKKIKSHTILVTKPIEIDLTDKGFTEEEQLRQKMIGFLRELENDAQN